MFILHKVKSLPTLHVFKRLSSILKGNVMSGFTSETNNS